ANPLQLRPDRFSEENAPRERRAWYSCACCPPNLARLLAQVSAYVATSTDDELALHLYADAEIDVPAHLGGGVLRVETSYPDDGAVRLRHDGDRPLRLALRVPSWSSRTVLDGAPAEADADGYLRVDLAGAATLELDLAPRWTRAHHRADALRGARASDVCLRVGRPCAARRGLVLAPRWPRAPHRADALRGARAIEVGPRVYCVEQVDLPDDVALDDLVVDERAPLVRADGATVRTTAAVRPRADALYGPTEQDLSAGEVAVVAIPFARWGNRGSSAMRVWLPVV